MSPLARAGVALGVLLGVVAVLAADGGELTPESVPFLLMVVGFAVIPYFVFARVERTWSRPLAIAVLAVLAAAHLAVTIDILATLDEDALNGIGFLTIPPLLAAAVGVVGIAVTLTRAVAARRR